MGRARPRRPRRLPLSEFFMRSSLSLIACCVVAAAAVLAGGCRRTDIVGSLGCSTSPYAGAPVLKSRHLAPTGWTGTEVTR